MRCGMRVRNALDDVASNICRPLLGDGAPGMVLSVSPGGGAAYTSVSAALAAAGAGEGGGGAVTLQLAPGKYAERVVAGPHARGLHSLTSMLNLMIFGNTSLTLKLNLSTFGTHPRANLGYLGEKVSLS
jgi:hypothetical protein